MAVATQSWQKLAQIQTVSVLVGWILGLSFALLEIKNIFFPGLKAAFNFMLVKGASDLLILYL